MKIGLFYGTTSQNTRLVAERIRDRLGAERLSAFRDIQGIDPHDLEGFEVLILGIPTYNVGELQLDWETLFPRLDEVDLAGTKVVLFGLGDVGGYPDTYQDALGIVYRKLLERGAAGGIGFWPTEGYDHFDSKAIVEEGKFCGLALDEETEADLTDDRIERWCAQIEGELGLD